MIDDDREKYYGGHDGSLKGIWEEITHLQISPDIPK